MSILRSIDLARLNSMTKYPSIPTYHALDPSNGRLTEMAISFNEDTVIGTEKVDGTNARIILMPDGDYVLGSREELLYAKGDLIGNPALGIVEALKKIADRQISPKSGEISICYVEVFGGNVTKASRQYTSAKDVSVRLFDVASVADFYEILAKSPEQISAWREHGGQSFHDENSLESFEWLTKIALTPRVCVISAQELPTTIVGMREFLAEHMPTSLCRLDEEAGGQPEGIVFRTPDRSVIAKARFADYARTLRTR